MVIEGAEAERRERTPRRTEPSATGPRELFYLSSPPILPIGAGNSGIFGIN